MQQDVSLESTAKCRSRRSIKLSVPERHGTSDPREPLLRVIAQKIVGDYLKECLVTDNLEGYSRRSKNRPKHTIKATD